MKKTFTLALLFVFFISITENTSAAKPNLNLLKTQKAKIVVNESSVESNVAIPEAKALPIRSQIINSARIEVGKSDYDYGFNSGGSQSIVTAGGKVYTVFNERDGINNTTAPANRRAVKYTYIDGATKVEGYPVPKATAQTGFGGVDAAASGPAQGFGMVVGHTPNWFAIENAAGTGNFSTISLPKNAGTVDPEVTFDNARQRVFVQWSGMGGSRADYVVSYSDDFGATWKFADAAGDSQLCTNGAGLKGQVSGSLDVPVLVAPNGTVSIATTVSGTGANSPNDSSDAIGYFKSTNGGETFAWTTIGEDGDRYIIGSDTLYAFYENFGQMGAVYDKDSKLNIVVNGYLIKVVNDSTSANYFCTLYWKEGVTGFKVISNANQMRIAEYDSYSYSGNAMGFAYPSIAQDPTGTTLFAAWSQPRIVNGKIDTGAGGIANYDLWYSASANGGTSWKAASKIPGTNGALFNWTARNLDKSGNDFIAHILYIQDTTVGCFVFGEGARSLAPTVYENFKFNATTGVGDENRVAKNFALEQNYPNPFNPSTKINYSIAKSSKVTLSIYNVMGQEVAQLVNGVQDAGNHSINFDGSKLSSGVYLYKLTAGSFQEIKKMVLMK